MRYQRPKQSSMLPAIIFLFLGISSGVGIFYIMSIFMFFQYMTVTGFNKADKRKQENPQRPIQRRRKAASPIVKSNPFKKSGLQKYKDFDIEDAIVDFEKGLEIEPNDKALHWNLAAAYSLSENKVKAFYHLQKAVENGFNDFDKIASHDDLAYIRIQPEYDALSDSTILAISDIE